MAMIFKCDRCGKIGGEGLDVKFPTFIAQLCNKCLGQADKFVRLGVVADAFSDGMLAQEVARFAHAGQKDQKGNPYIEHPARVAAAVRHLGTDYEITAWLHDVVEDTTITLEMVQAAFGDTIAAAVASVTRIASKMPAAHAEGISKKSGVITFKEPYGDFILRANANPIGRAVKIADIEDWLAPERLLPELKDKYQDALDILNSEDDE